jgi:hypothetical protein
MSDNDQAEGTTPPDDEAVSVAGPGGSAEGEAEEPESAAPEGDQVAAAEVQDQTPEAAARSFIEGVLARRRMNPADAAAYWRPLEIFEEVAEGDGKRWVGYEGIVADDFVWVSPGTYQGTKTDNHAQLASSELIEKLRQNLQLLGVIGNDGFLFSAVQRLLGGDVSLDELIAERKITRPPAAARKAAPVAVKASARRSSGGRASGSDARRQPRPAPEAEASTKAAPDAEPQVPQEEAMLDAARRLIAIADEDEHLDFSIGHLRVFLMVMFPSAKKSMIKAIIKKAMEED